MLTFVYTFFYRPARISERRGISWSWDPARWKRAWFPKGPLTILPCNRWHAVASTICSSLPAHVFSILAEVELSRKSSSRSSWTRVSCGRPLWVSIFWLSSALPFFRPQPQGWSPHYDRCWCSLRSKRRNLLWSLLFWSEVERTKIDAELCSEG